MRNDYEVPLSVYETENKGEPVKRNWGEIKRKLGDRRMNIKLRPDPSYQEFLSMVKNCDDSKEFADKLFPDEKEHRAKNKKTLNRLKFYAKRGDISITRRWGKPSKIELTEQGKEELEAEK